MTRAFGALLMTVIPALCAGVLIVAFLLPTRPADEAVGWSDGASLVFQPHPGARLPLAARLIDETGRKIALAEYFEKSPVILVLDYLRCTSLCGVTLRNLVDALGALPLDPGRDYQFVTISIDPRDGPADAAAARAKYAGLLNRDGGHDESGDRSRNGSRNGMHFLTAVSPADVRGIAETVGFPYRYDALIDAYLHPAGFIIASPDGAISRYVEGVALSPPELIDAFADAEQDKSQGPLARLLLLCHAQGAALGRFTVPVLAAFTIGDIAAGLTAFAIFTAVRRRRNG